MAPLTFGKDIFDSLSAEARATPRKRKNLNFHPSADFPAHRFLNAIEPDSYGRPHRHLEPNKDETFVVLRGRVGLLLFDEKGRVTARSALGDGCDAVGVNIPVGRFHGVVSLESGTILLEAKAGPYVAATDKDWAPWAPPEGAPDAMAYLELMRKEFRLARD